MEKNDFAIPFVCPVRVGNYKLWRGRYNIGKGKEKTSLECLHVSNLDGSWMVRIPSTLSMFTTICNGYATTNTEMRDNFLGMLFTNIYNISTSSSETLHDALFFFTEMLSFPYLLLSEKEMCRRMEKGMKDAGFDKSRRKEHIGKMCDYRRQLYELIEQKRSDLIDVYERQQASRRSQESDKDMEQEALAEQAMDILSGDGTV